MSCADAVAKLLADGHFSCYFSKVLPSALDCSEPIVVTESAFVRESRMAEEERGTVSVTVMVVREVSADAEAVAGACERAVRSGAWEPYAEMWPWRIIGVDTSAPSFKERDSSGRFVWTFEVACTVVREL
ncbi:MAG: hypothetical protein IJ087_02230 [Eggerthellaceae bacterium]|nr:hypothetical protein [Eggerthellaceae bacterium]